MALQRPLAKALGCNGCRQWVLRSFIAAVGGRATYQPTSFQSPRRVISSASRPPNQTTGKMQQEDDALNDISEDFHAPPHPELASEPPPSPAKEEHVPWYLQVQQPLQQPESPMTARQRIPHLPDSPPDILQPLLEHVSVQLGMDDLSILDLRSLDPPPALGANLVMIIGTARSEKHLHVSADRLCRWLRTEYKMSPFADGLLGRNELKLKMRRKAKRSRLLSAVGSKATTDVEELDDGIRTGWVCVNVGRVAGGELPEDSEKFQRAEGIVGFGARTEGTNIVVQMMTDEKRGEIDLEKLWTDMLTRAKREQRKLDESEGEAAEDAVVDEMLVQEDTPSRPVDLSASTSYSPMSQVSNQNTGQQLRAYHSSARRPAISESHRDPPTASSVMPPAPHGVKIAQPDPSIAKLSELLADIRVMSTGKAFKALGDDLLSSPLSRNSPESQERSLSTEMVPPTSTPFLRAFYAAMPTFPQPEHWHQHISLLAHARQLGHTHAHGHVLIAQLFNMQLAGLTPTEDTFKLVLRSVLLPLGATQPYDGRWRVPSDSKIADILAVLEEMEACGYDPVQRSVLELLYRACVGGEPQPGACELDTIVPALAAARLKRHAQNGDWPSFWRCWRSYPQRFLPRSAGLYRVLFEVVGEERLEWKEAVEVIRSAVESMEAEEPAVVLEQDVRLAEALRGALEFVDPAGERGVEWRGWWQRCRAVVE